MEKEHKLMNKTNMLAAGIMAATIGAGLATQAKAGPAGIDRKFAVSVSQGNNAEIMASRLALKKSTSTRVRSIATMLITQHGQAQDSLVRVAGMEKIMLPPGTDAKHRAEYRKLKSLSGDAFDRAYIAGLVPDHYMTIGLFNQEMTNGGDSEVRSFAAKYLPAIQTHTKMITSLASNYHIPVSDTKMVAR